MDRKSNVLSCHTPNSMSKNCQSKSGANKGLQDQSQQMKKRLLTSYIENKKFDLKNFFSSSNKKFPFNSLISRFSDKSYKGDINGTLVTHSRKTMRASLSLDNLCNKYGVARYSIHKNKSQSLMDLSKNFDGNDVKKCQKKLKADKLCGYASGSINNLLMSTPLEDQSSKVRLSNKRYEVSDIFTPYNGSIKKLRKSSSLEKKISPTTNQKLSDVYQRINSYQKLLASVNNEKIDVINLNNERFIEKEVLKLNKNSSSFLNSSLLSTKDINTIKTKNLNPHEIKRFDLSNRGNNISKQSNHE